MRLQVFISVFLLLSGAIICSADIIYLKNGNQFEVEDAEIVGEKVVFTVFNGQMEIDLAAVARIERTSTPARPDAGLRNSISGTPFSRGQTSGTSSQREGGTAANAEEEERNQELVQFYVAQKQQLQKEIAMYDSQIQTLRSAIYAKAAIFSDTTQDRQNLRQAEEQKRAAEERLQTLMNEAQRSGLTPGDIRKIEDSQYFTPSSQVSTIGGQEQDARDANVSWIDIKEADDDRWSSDVLTEEEDNKEKSEKK
jgi:hypothetical protein